MDDQFEQWPPIEGDVTVNWPLTVIMMLVIVILVAYFV